jgi:hypothetical protein
MRFLYHIRYPVRGLMQLEHLRVAPSAFTRGLEASLVAFLPNLSTYYILLQ